MSDRTTIVDAHPGAECVGRHDASPRLDFEKDAGIDERLPVRAVHHRAEFAAGTHVDPDVGYVPGSGTEPLLEEPGLGPASPELLYQRIEHAIEREDMLGLGPESSVSRFRPLDSSRWSPRYVPAW